MYEESRIREMQSTYRDYEIKDKANNFKIDSVRKELENKISELESSLSSVMEELDYIKNGRKDVLSKQEVANLFKMLPPTNQRSVSIPVTIDQGGTGVTTLAAAQALFSGVITSGNYFYFGDSTTNGSWRIYDNGTNLITERRESGVWVEKSAILST